MNIVISDGLIGSPAPVGNTTFVVKEGIKLEGVCNVISMLVKDESVTSESVIIISVGSWNITASYHGLEENCRFTAAASEVFLHKAVRDLKRTLKCIKSLCEAHNLSVIITSLIPLPDEQDCDASDANSMTELMSKLFVAAQELIFDFNGGLEYTPLICKFLVKANHKKYFTGQLKIKPTSYKDGMPTTKIKEKMVNKILSVIDKEQN